MIRKFANRKEWHLGMKGFPNLQMTFKNHRHKLVPFTWVRDILVVICIQGARLYQTVHHNHMIVISKLETSVLKMGQKNLLLRISLPS